MANPHGERRGKAPPLLALLGLSLVLVGIGAVVLSGSEEARSREARVVGPDAPVNVGATDPEDISAHNSPSLVRNPARPANLVVSSRIDTPFFSCGLHVSTDGGESFTQTSVPAPEGEEAKCYAPDVAFSTDGTLYLSFVTLKGRGNVPNAVWLSSSDDGGQTLSEPTKITGPLAFQVRIAADPTDPQRLYVTWLQGGDVAALQFAEPGNPIRAVRSDDGGSTWTSPEIVSSDERERVITPSPVVGPDGELYVLYVDIGEDTLDYAAGHGGRGGPPYDGNFELVLARSEDRGATWAESVVDSRIRAISRFVVFFPPFPSLAVAPDGRVYAAFHDRRLGDPDVMLWSLGTGESDWEGPIRVNDTPRRDGTSQYLPKLAVAPNGRLDVLYYDRRAGGADDVMNEVSLQSSFDRGESFGPRLRLSSRAFDSRIGFGAKEGLPDLGSRLGLLSTESSAVGVWTDTRAGSAATQKQDIGSAEVAFTSSAQEAATTGDDRLRYGGIGLGALGLALLGLFVLGQRGVRLGPRLRRART